MGSRSGKGFYFFKENSTIALSCKLFTLPICNWAMFLLRQKLSNAFKVSQPRQKSLKKNIVAGY